MTSGPGERPLRVAVVGAGPAGIYTAEALVEQDEVPVAVDLVDRVPTPFGLVRHGIAPDHLRMRALRDTLREVLDHERVRFVGNVEVGVDISVEELTRHVDAVVYTFGAAADRRIGIDGEDLPGVLPATAVVSWYTGHPDADRARVEAALAAARDVVVVGVGNVALDVARVLARSPAELEHTDMPQHVLDALAAAPVERVTVLGRRGPAQATFTAQELRELGHLEQATVVVDAGQLAADAPAGDRIAARNLTTLRGWVGNTVDAGRVAVRLRFFARPLRLYGDERVTAVEVERTEPTADGVVGSGETDLVPADLVIRSVGYRGSGLPGVAVDAPSGTVLNAAGRVLRDGRPVAGEYVAGWIKRGPSGVVGTNKLDAAETVASLLADVASGDLTRRDGGVDDLVTTLVDRGAAPVLLDHWADIDAAEKALGATRGRPRTALHSRTQLLAAAHGRHSTLDHTTKDVNVNALPDDLDPFAETADSMLDLYREAHAQGCPVIHSSAHGGFDMVVSHAAIREAASDWETFSSANGVTLPRFPVRNVAIEHDPPDHTYWRGVYSAILSPGAIRKAEESVRQDAVALIGAFADRGDAELVTELTKIIPGNTICRLLGITDPEQVALGCRLGVALAEAVFDPAQAPAAFGAFGGFVMGEIGDRRAAPRGDFLSRVANEEIDGHRLTDDEIMGMATGFFIAGHETTTSGMTSLFHVIATQPEVRDRLIAEPGLIRRAAEEAIRLESPLHGFFRTATRDVDLAGTHVAAGSEVWLNYAAGNRDPEVFPDPETFMVDRRPNPHLAYGYGIHTCVGAPLARMELLVVTGELLTRLPDLTWAGGDRERRLGGFNIMSTRAVPVTFTPVAAPVPVG